MGSEKKSVVSLRSLLGRARGAVLIALLCCRPLNPVLGELFYGTWPAPASNPGQGKTTLLVEQVSHHPPITAYVIENKTKGLRLTGHNAQKTSFSGGSIIVKQIGHAVLTYTPPAGPRVEYLLTLPRLRIDGLWYGSPYIELTETTYIVGGGFVCTIEYKGRGYFSGKSHSFKAHVVPAPGMGGAGAGAEEHVVEGTWHEKSKLVKGGSRHQRADGAFHDAGEERKKEVTALGGEADGSMGEFETRRLWAAVAKGIREGDFETASREKSRIENEQRQRRRDEVAAGTSWELKHFKRVENDSVYERLARLVPKLTPATEDCYEFLENGPQ
ncbi:hypothetical protein C0993_001502 [Termitomyces sp. T159_Od127]|nr:hypothetical protein C0993_001502 [Termitomyces sp. T159_Od127]